MNRWLRELVIFDGPMRVGLSFFYGLWASLSFVYLYMIIYESMLICSYVLYVYICFSLFLGCI